MITHRLSVGFASLALAAGAGAWAFAQQGQPVGQVQGNGQPDAEENEVEIKLAEAPAAVQATVAKLTTVANVKRVTKEEDEGITTYEVEFTENGVECSAAVSTAGDVMELEKATPPNKLPAALMDALKEEYPTATLADAQIVTKTCYEIKVVIDGKTHEVTCDAAGNIDDEYGEDADDDEDDGDHANKNDSDEDHEEEGDDDD